jgi:hypothetical protein
MLMDKYLELSVRYHALSNLHRRKERKTRLPLINENDDNKTVPDTTDREVLDFTSRLPSVLIPSPRVYVHSILTVLPLGKLSFDMQYFHPNVKCLACLASEYSRINRTSSEPQQLVC